MHIVMAVAAEVLPVGTIRRIIVMIAVAMMDREEMGIRLIELAGAAGTDESEQAEGFLPIVGVVIDCGPHFAKFCRNFCFCRQLDAGRSAGFHFTT